MKSLTAKDLQKLVASTHTFLRLYYKKDKWHHLFPLLSELSQLYDNIFLTNPDAMLAQTMFYIEQQGYTTNRVINHCVLVLATCHAMSISSEHRQKMIAVCLCQFICVQKENNELASGKSLNPQSAKLWQKRHHYALGLLKYGKVFDPTINFAMANLKNYQMNILTGSTASFVDEFTLIIALTDNLAKQITLAKNHSAKTLDSALSNLYRLATHINANNIIKTLTHYLPVYMPASSVINSKNKGVLHLGELTKNKQLNVKLSNSKNLKDKELVISGKRLEFSNKQQVCSDKHLIFEIWFEPIQEFLQANNQIKAFPLNKAGKNNNNQLFIALNQKKYWDLEELNQLLVNSPDINELFCKLVSSKNKTNQNITQSKHALMMLGLYRSPFTIKKIILLSLIEQLNLPNANFIMTRLNSLCNIAETCVSNNQEIIPEQMSILVLSLYYYILSQPKASFSPAALTASTLSSRQILAPETIISFTGIDYQNLKEFLTVYNLDSKAHNAALLLTTKTDTLNQVKMDVWLSGLILTIISGVSIFHMDTKLSPFILQIKDTCKSHLNIKANHENCQFLSKAQLQN